MKKKSIAARLGVAALALTLVTTSLSSGTLAKYSTVLNAGGSLLVAKWNVGATVEYTDPQDGSLKKKKEMISDALTASDLFSLSETAKGLQKDRVSTGKIAPGMEGEFDILLNTAGAGFDTATEVDVEYKIYISNNGAFPDNFVMWDKKKNPTGTGGGLTIGSTDTLLADGMIDAGDASQEDGKNATRYVTIGWKWPYEPGGGGNANDEKDTINGASAVGSTFTIKVVMEQGNPKDARPTPSTAPVE